MARFKQSSKRSSSTARPEAQAERLSKSISESAQQIWLAGVGAFGRAQAEGTPPAQQDGVHPFHQAPRPQQVSLSGARGSTAHLS